MAIDIMGNQLNLIMTDDRRCHGMMRNDDECKGESS
jgi:hypothetical protein